MHFAFLDCPGFPALPVSKEKQKDSPAAIGECYCSRLFKLEEAFAELTPEEIKTHKPTIVQVGEGNSIVRQ